MRLIHQFPDQAQAQLPAAIGWLPLVLLSLTSLTTRGLVQPWVFMWIVAVALWAGCKWLIFWREIESFGLPNFWKAIAFLFLWPGMDAGRFFRGTKPARTSPVMISIINVALGTLLICFVAPRLNHELLKGWVAMLGIILALHFGLFNLIAVVWQKCGFDAEPLMCSPAKATSLAEFWGRRWNTAFNRLVFQLIFRPIARVIGGRLALMTTFLASGLIHELVITVPARGGYGLPTAYFLLQGCGVLFESSDLGNQMKLRHGIRGWLFTVLFTAGPAYILFPPVFVQNIILPMLRIPIY